MKVTSELRDALDKWFDEKREPLIADVSRLIAQPSIAGEAAPGAPYGADARAALDLSAEILENLGFTTSMFEDMMIEADLNAAPGGVKTPEIGFLVHADTVAAPLEGWTSDPFRAEVRGEADGGADNRNGDGKSGRKLYGRGATDNKGPAVAAMYALAAARDIAAATGRTAKSARIIVGSAEELGCVDLARYLEVREPPRFSVAPDSNYPVVTVEKGRFIMKFRGEWEASGAVPRVVSVTGGKTSNIVPGFASAKILGMTAAELAATCARYAEITSAAISVRQDGDYAVITSFGAAAHASRPLDGNNAQTALLSLLAALPLADSGSSDAMRSLARLFPHNETDGSSVGIAASDDVSGALTLSFNVLELNETGFTANFDARTPQASDAMDIVGITENALKTAGFAADGFTRSSCHVTDKDSPYVQTLLGIYEAFTGQPGACLSLGGTTYAHNIPGAVAFGCEMPGTDHRIHGADEFIPLDTLFTTAKMLAALLLAEE